MSLKAPGRRALTLWTAVIIVALLGACQEQEPTPAPQLPDATDVSSDDGSMEPEDGAGDGGQETADDTEDDAEVLPETFFELGTNITGAAHPDFYAPVPEGTELHIELGAQGLWMVVLAFKTRGIFEDRVIVRGKLEIAGVNQGELALAKQKLIEGGDGYRYYYNFFLVVLDPGVAGLQGLVTLRVQDDANKELEKIIERQVVLTGGMPSAAPLCEPECGDLEQCFNQQGEAVCTCIAGTALVDEVCTHLCDPPCGQLAICVEGDGGNFCQCMDGVDPENGDCVAP